MSNLNLRNDRNNINHILEVSIKLVVLQNLQTAYIFECESGNPQELCTFRSACVLDEIKLILDNLRDHISWLVAVENGQIKATADIKEAVDALIKDLDKIYLFTLEEVAKKEERLRLLDLEKSMFINE